MSEYCSICKDQKVCKGYFGLCLVCHGADGCANAGRSHRFYCKEHKTSWPVGSNQLMARPDRSGATRNLG